MSNNSIQEDNSHQVYIYYDPRKNYQAFYVGETGTEDRWLFHLGEAKKFIEQKKSQKWIGKNADNPHKTRTIMKILEAGLEPKIEKVMENVDEKTSKAEEIRLIAYHGRADKGLGYLTNMTDGGDGCSGIIWTEESRQKLSKTIKGRKKTKEHLRKISDGNKGKVGSNRGKKFSKEWCDNMSKALKGCEGRKKTQEEKDKISIKIKEFNNSEEGKRIRKEAGKKAGLKQKGKKIKPESIAKSIKTRRENGNNKHSESTKEKCRQKTIDYWDSLEGQKQKEKMRDKIPLNKGKKCYNNGIITKYFLEGDQPEGWVKGSIKNP